MDIDNPQTDKPLLFLDVDGVISIFGVLSARDAAVPLREIDTVPHCILPEAGPRLVQLHEWFDLVWASGWEGRANQYLPDLLELPFGDLPTLTFGGRAAFGSSHWKLDAISAHAGNRPAAWVDDNIDDACRLWALGRDAPTLLVETEPNVGITENQVEMLCDWACTEAIAPSEEPTAERAFHPRRVA